MAGIVTQDRTVATPATVAVDGQLSGTADWAIVALEIRPARATPAISVTPASHDYGQVVLGGSATRTFVVANGGAGTLQVSAVEIVGPDAAEFGIAPGPAPFSLAPAETRDVAVSFAPAGIGAKAAQLRLASNDQGRSPLDLPLSGTGIPAPEPDVAVTPLSHDYGNVLVGTTATSTFRIQNAGAAPLVVSAATLGGSHASSFAIEGTGAPFTLAPAEAMDLAIRFAPGAPGGASATLRVASDDPDESGVDVALAGTGVAPEVVVDPVSHDFGDVLLGATASRPFQIRNEGTSALAVSAVELAGADAPSFAIESGGAPFALAPGGTLDISVRFVPDALGAKSAVLRIGSDDADEPVLDAALAGTGVEPDIAVSPPAHDFGSVLLGDAATWNVEILNEGTATLAIEITEMVGPGSPSFSIDSGSGPVTIAPGGSWPVVVRFAPSALGPAAAALRIGSDDPDESAVDVVLAGSGFDYGPDAIVLAETRSGGSGGSSSVATASSLTAVPGDLYLAAISTKGYRRTVGVSGLGLSWTAVVSQCAVDGRTGVDVWMAQGTPTASARVTATLEGPPNSAAIVVSRYAGVDEATPIGALVSRNGNGVSGSCGTGPEGSSYVLNLSTSAERAVVFAAASMRQRQHTAGAGWTERAEVHQGAGGNETSVATMDRLAGMPGAVSANGSFDGSVDWAAAAIELRPATIILTAAAARLPTAGEDPSSARPQDAPGSGGAAMTDAPLSFGLSAGRPNPFREGTTLEYALPAADVVDIAVYDAAGRLVRRLANGPQSPGVHEVRWNGRNDSGVSVGSGVYFLRVRAGSQALLRKLVLVN
jgi:hypothetical protein